MIFKRAFAIPSRSCLESSEILEASELHQRKGRLAARFARFEWPVPVIFSRLGPVLINFASRSFEKSHF